MKVCPKSEVLRTKNKIEVLFNEATPSAGVAFAFIFYVYSVIKLYFVSRCITENRIGKVVEGMGSILNNGD